SAAQSVFASDPTAVDMIPRARIPRHMGEMVGLVAMPGLAAVAVPEEAVIAPIAVIKRAIKAVIITVIVIRTAGDADGSAGTRTGGKAGKTGDKDRGKGELAHGSLHVFCPLQRQQRAAALAVALPFVGRPAQQPMARDRKPS